LIPSLYSAVFLTASSTTVIYTLSLHDALPIYLNIGGTFIMKFRFFIIIIAVLFLSACIPKIVTFAGEDENWEVIFEVTNDKIKKDRKSTRLNSSHVKISYAVFCLKKKTRPRQK